MSWPVIVASPSPTVVLVGAALLLVAMWIWGSRLTGPVTRQWLQRWRDELARRPDGFRRLAEVGWWATLHDGLRNLVLVIRADRYGSAAASLHVSMYEAVRAGARVRNALATRRQAGPPSLRPHLSPLMAGRVLPVATAAADWVLATVALAAMGLDTARSFVAAVPTAVAMAVSGRMIGVAIRAGRPWNAAVPAGAAMAIAFTLAHAQPEHAQRFFVVALAPVFVGAAAFLLGHLNSPEIEAADDEIRRGNRAARRSVRRLGRHLARTEGRRARLAALAAHRVVARPRVAANGEQPPITHLDAVEFLAEMGVVTEPELVVRAHRLLDELAAELAIARPNLRSVS